MKRNRVVLRRCISCRKTFNRDFLLKITKDSDSGILINSGVGRSAYICKTSKCAHDSKLKKNLQRSLKTSFNQFFYDLFTMETQNYK